MGCISIIPHNQLFFLIFNFIKMTNVKNISKESYVWGHVGVIIYHALTAITLIISQYVKNILGFSSRSVVIFLAVLLLIVTLLSIWPISKDYDRIVIE